jgi:hypothetical protein
MHEGTPMKRTALLIIMNLLPLSLYAAAPEEVRAAIAKLTGAPSYSWKTTWRDQRISYPFLRETRERANAHMSEQEGTVSTDGILVSAKFHRLPPESRNAMPTGSLQRPFGIGGCGGADSSYGGFQPFRFTMIREGNSTVVSPTGLQQWTNVGGIRKSDPMLALAAESITVPTVQAAQLLNGCSQVKFENGVSSGTLTETAVKEWLSWAAILDWYLGTDRPPLSTFQATAKFWIQDGMLLKYECHLLEPDAPQNSGSQNVGLHWIVEIQNVGKAKVEVPTDAKKALHPPK